MKACFDCETSIIQKGHPYTPENFMVSYIFHFEDGTQVYKYYKDPDFTSYLKKTFSEVFELIGFNLKFDIAWARRYGAELREDVEIFDCQIAEFIYSGQTTSFASLNECLESYGLPLKKDVVKEYWDAGISTENIPEDILEEYTRWDGSSTWNLYKEQLQVLRPEELNLVYWDGQDLLTLQDAEQNGTLFNKEAAAQHAEQIQTDVRAIEQQLMEHITVPDYVTFNFDSGDHLSAFLYGGTIKFSYSTSEQAVYKSGAKKGQEYVKNSWHEYEHTFLPLFTPLDKTEVKKTIGRGQQETHFYQVDEPTLKQLKGTKAAKAILSLLLARGKAIKVAEMVESLIKIYNEKGWENNFLHPQFNQTVARTGRLSSSAPNLQNQPPEIDEYFVSRYETVLS